MEEEVSLYSSSSPRMLSCLNPKVCFHRCSDAPFSNPPIHLPPPTATDREAKANGGGGDSSAKPNPTRLACQRGGE